MQGYEEIGVALAGSVTRSESDRNVSSSRVRKALIPSTLFNRSASVLANASVMVFSGVLVPAPVAPASIPPCPASTATVKTLSFSAIASASGAAAVDVAQFWVFTRSAKTSLDVISASRTSL